MTGGSRVSTWLIVGWAALLATVPIGLFAAESMDLLRADVLFRDTAVAAGAPYYYGWASTLGNLMWSAAAGACIVPAVTLGTGHPLRMFFFSSFLLSALLAPDDALLWHEEFLPARGIPEPIVYALYGLAVLAWLIVNRSVFRRTRFRVLIAALGFLGASVFLDFYERVFDPLPSQVLIEDGLKFVGIGLWLAYLVGTGILVVTALVHRPLQSRDGVNGQ
jgi:hypothetical protein